MIDCVLASGSPRRKELLEQAGMKFRIEAAHGDEIITKTEPDEIVEELSLQKAIEVADRIEAVDVAERQVVIGADTIVALQQQIMGKPKDAEDAKMMISRLQNQTHQVYTGVTVIIEDLTERKVITFSEKTDVIMYPMSDSEIDEYVSGVEKGNISSDNKDQMKPWFGKAGAYGIQDTFGLKYIKGIEGNYYNVVGLPVARLLQELKKAGITI